MGVRSVRSTVHMRGTRGWVDPPARGPFEGQVVVTGRPLETVDLWKVDTSKGS